LAVSVDALPARIRHRFPIFDRLVYINSCSQGALSDAVRDAYARYLDDWDEHGAPWEYWVEQLRRCPAERGGSCKCRGGRGCCDHVRFGRRQRARERLGFDEDRDKVVVSDSEFPTIGQIWHAQERRGARVVHVPAEADGTDPARALDAAIDEETALVAITHVCFRNGVRLDVAGVIELAHERGALVLLDAYQSVGSLPVDVRALDCDFLAAGVLKYLLGSAGLGFFYLPPRSRRADRADRDRVVRRPQHLRDGHPRLLARDDRPPV